MSRIFGSTTAGVIIFILIALVIGLLLVMLNLNLRMSRLQRRYRLFMKGTDGQSVEKAMAGKLIELGKLRSGQEQTNKELDSLQDQYDRMLCKYGIVKYDAFEDVGGKMSFALAMLDRENTGFVLNAIHSRDNCFLYLKDVVKGTSYIMLSDEEIEALRRAARSGEETVPTEKAEKKKAGKNKKPAEGEGKATLETAKNTDGERAEDESPPFAETSAQDDELRELEKIIESAHTQQEDDGTREEEP